MHIISCTTTVRPDYWDKSSMTLPLSDLVSLARFLFCCSFALSPLFCLFFFLHFLVVLGGTHLYTIQQCSSMRIPGFSTPRAPVYSDLDSESSHSHPGRGGTFQPPPLDIFLPVSIFFCFSVFSCVLLLVNFHVFYSLFRLSNLLVSNNLQNDGPL